MSIKMKPFQLKAASALLDAAGLRTGLLPMEIWDEQGRSRVWTGVTGQEIRLRRNKNYLVSTVIPGIGTISKRLELLPELTEFTVGFEQVQRECTQASPAAGSAPQGATIEFFTANLLADAGEPNILETRPLTVVPDVPAVAMTAPAGRRGTSYLRIRRSGFPSLNVSIPQCPEESSTISVQWLANGTPTVDIKFQNAEANLLLDYASELRPRQIDALARTHSILGQAAGDISSPLGAIVGGYVSLRIGAGELEAAQRGALFETLFRRWPGIPDTAVLWAEHNARAGQHEIAADALCTLLDHGLPSFTSGIGYALKRLDRYALQTSTEVVQRLRTRLGIFASATDPARQIATFHADDPVLWRRTA